MDPFLLMSQLLLLALGANAVAVSAPELLPGHLLRAGLALVITLGVARTPLRLWLQASPLLYLTSLVLLVATLFFGVLTNGAQRWLDIKGFSLQASEFAKIFLILYLARYLDRHGPDYPIAGPVGLVGVGAALVLLQPDFTSAIFLLGLAALLLIAAGVPARRLIAIGTSALFAALAVSGIFAGRLAHVFERLQAFFSGEDVYQIRQGLKAIHEGGLFGQGPGATLYPPVPYAYNDSAFAALAFALGAVGVIVLFLAYTLILGRGLQIAFATEGATSLVALGVTATILLEAALHVAVNLGLLPPTGLPLPLVSYGGSAMIAHGIALGLLHAAAREARRAAVQTEESA